jgi:hypothetical protein
MRRFLDFGDCCDQPAYRGLPSFLLLLEKTAILHFIVVKISKQTESKLYRNSFGRDIRRVFEIHKHSDNPTSPTSPCVMSFITTPRLKTRRRTTQKISFVSAPALITRLVCTAIHKSSEQSPYPLSSYLTQAPPLVYRVYKNRACQVPGPLL